MEYRQALGYDLSRLVLGTAQLGMEYGIANTTGRPDLNEAKAVVATALNSGVNTFDTAAAYGESEAVLGRLLVDKLERREVIVVTKLAPLREGAAGSGSQARQVVRDSLAASRQRLRASALPIVLAHGAADVTVFDGAVAEEMQRQVEAGAVEHIGVSVYTPEEALALVEHDLIEAIQIPLPVVDQRPVWRTFLDRATARGTAVFARSVYLQGLLLMSPGDVPTELTEAVAHLERLRGIASREGRSVADLALHFPLAFPQVTGIVVGAERADQLADTLGELEKPPLSAELLEELREEFSDVPEQVLNPSLWPRQQSPIRRQSL